MLPLTPAIPGARLLGYMNNLMREETPTRSEVIARCLTRASKRRKPEKPPHRILSGGVAFDGIILSSHVLRAKATCQPILAEAFSEGLDCFLLAAT
jgi:hypothetical protein